MKEKYDLLRINTKNTALLWKNVHGIATEATAQK